MTEPLISLDVVRQMMGSAVTVGYGPPSYLGAGGAPPPAPPPIGLPASTSPRVGATATVTTTSSPLSATTSAPKTVVVSAPHSPPLAPRLSHSLDGAAHPLPVGRFSLAVPVLPHHSSHPHQSKLGSSSVVDPLPSPLQQPAHHHYHHHPSAASLDPHERSHHTHSIVSNQSVDFDSAVQQPPHSPSRAAAAPLPPAPVHRASSSATDSFPFVAPSYSHHHHYPADQPPSTPLAMPPSEPNSFSPRLARPVSDAATTLLPSAPLQHRSSSIVSVGGLVSPSQQPQQQQQAALFPAGRHFSNIQRFSSQRSGSLSVQSNNHSVTTESIPSQFLAVPSPRMSRKTSTSLSVSDGLLTPIHGFTTGALAGRSASFVQLLMVPIAVDPSEDVMLDSLRWPSPEAAGGAHLHHGAVSSASVTSASWGSGAPPPRRGAHSTTIAPEGTASPALSKRFSVQQSNNNKSGVSPRAPHGLAIVTAIEEDATAAQQQQQQVSPPDEAGQGDSLRLWHHHQTIKTSGEHPNTNTGSFTVLSSFEVDPYTTAPGTATLTLTESAFTAATERAESLPLGSVVTRRASGSSHQHPSTTTTTQSLRHSGVFFPPPIVFANSIAAHTAPLPLVAVRGMGSNEGGGGGGLGSVVVGVEDLPSSSSTVTAKSTTATDIGPSTMIQPSPAPTPAATAMGGAASRSPSAAPPSSKPAASPSSSFFIAGSDLQHVLANVVPPSSPEYDSGTIAMMLQDIVVAGAAAAAAGGGGMVGSMHDVSDMAAVTASSIVTFFVDETAQRLSIILSYLEEWTDVRFWGVSKKATAKSFSSGSSSSAGPSSGGAPIAAAPSAESKTEHTTRPEATPTAAPFRHEQLIEFAWDVSHRFLEQEGDFVDQWLIEHLALGPKPLQLLLHVVQSSSSTIVGSGTIGGGAAVGGPSAAGEANIIVGGPHHGATSPLPHSGTTSVTDEFLKAASSPSNGAETSSSSNNARTASPRQSFELSTRSTTGPPPPHSAQLTLPSIPTMGGHLNVASEDGGGATSPSFADATSPHRASVPRLTRRAQSLQELYPFEHDIWNGLVGAIRVSVRVLYTRAWYSCLHTMLNVVSSASGTTIAQSESSSRYSPSSASSPVVPGSVASSAFGGTTTTTTMIATTTRLTNWEKCLSFDWLHFLDVSETPPQELLVAQPAAAATRNTSEPPPSQQDLTLLAFEKQHVVHITPAPTEEGSHVFPLIQVTPSSLEPLFNPFSSNNSSVPQRATTATPGRSTTSSSTEWHQWSWMHVEHEELRQRLNLVEVYEMTLPTLESSKRCLLALGSLASSLQQQRPPPGTELRSVTDGLGWSTMTPVVSANLSTHPILGELLQQVAGAGSGQFVPVVTPNSTVYSVSSSNGSCRIPRPGPLMEEAPRHDDENAELIGEDSTTEGSRKSSAASRSQSRASPKITAQHLIAAGATDVYGIYSAQSTSPWGTTPQTAAMAVGSSSHHPHTAGGGSGMVSGSSSGLIEPLRSRSVAPTPRGAANSRDYSSYSTTLLGPLATSPPGSLLVVLPEIGSEDFTATPHPRSNNGKMLNSRTGNDWSLHTSDPPLFPEESNADSSYVSTAAFNSSRAGAISPSRSFATSSIARVVQQAQSRSRPSPPLDLAVVRGHLARAGSLPMRYSSSSPVRTEAIVFPPPSSSSLNDSRASRSLSGGALRSIRQGGPATAHAETQTDLADFSTMSSWGPSVLLRNSTLARVMSTMHALQDNSTQTVSRDGDPLFELDVRPPTTGSMEDMLTDSGMRSRRVSLIPQPPLHDGSAAQQEHHRTPAHSRLDGSGSVVSPVQYPTDGFLSATRGGDLLGSSTPSTVPRFAAHPPLLSASSAATSATASRSSSVIAPRRSFTKPDSTMETWDSMDFVAAAFRNRLETQRRFYLAEEQARSTILEQEERFRTLWQGACAKNDVAYMELERLAMEYDVDALLLSGTMSDPVAARESEVKELRPTFVNVPHPPDASHPLSPSTPPPRGSAPPLALSHDRINNNNNNTNNHSIVNEVRSALPHDHHLTLFWRAQCAAAAASHSQHNNAVQPGLWESWRIVEANEQWERASRLDTYAALLRLRQAESSARSLISQSAAERMAVIESMRSVLQEAEGHRAAAAVTGTSPILSNKAESPAGAFLTIGSVGASELLPPVSLIPTTTDDGGGSSIVRSSGSNSPKPWSAATKSASRHASHSIKDEQGKRSSTTFAGSTLDAAGRLAFLLEAVTVERAALLAGTSSSASVADFSGSADFSQVLAMEEEAARKALQQTECSDRDRLSTRFKSIVFHTALHERDAADRRQWTINCARLVLHEDAGRQEIIRQRTTMLDEILLGMEFDRARASYSASLNVTRRLEAEKLLVDLIQIVENGEQNARETVVHDEARARKKLEGTLLPPPPNGASPSLTPSPPKHSPTESTLVVDTQSPKGRPRYISASFEFVGPPLRKTTSAPGASMVDSQFAQFRASSTTATTNNSIFNANNSSTINQLANNSSTSDSAVSSSWVLRALGVTGVGGAAYPKASLGSIHSSSDTTGSSGSVGSRGASTTQQPPSALAPHQMLPQTVRTIPDLLTQVRHAARTFVTAVLTDKGPSGLGVSWNNSSIDVGMTGGAAGGGGSSVGGGQSSVSFGSSVLTTNNNAAPPTSGGMQRYPSVGTPTFDTYIGGLRGGERSGIGFYEYNSSTTLGPNGVYFGQWEGDLRVGAAFYVDLTVLTSGGTSSSSALGTRSGVGRTVARTTVIFGRWAKDELAEVYWSVAGDVEPQHAAVLHSWL